MDLYTEKTTIHWSRKGRYAAVIRSMNYVCVHPLDCFTKPCKKKDWMEKKNRLLFRYEILVIYIVSSCHPNHEPHQKKKKKAI